MKATRLWSLWQAILLSFAIGFTRRGPLESWIMARSTLQVTISPGVTAPRSAARAMSF
jgi:hypothetical protein